MAKDSLEMEGREGSWRGYISPGLLAADMSQLLREAWVRCRNLGVDPAGGRCRRLLSKPEFAPYLAENRLLVKTAAAIFQESSDLTGSFPVAMFIATEDGIILETFGDTKIRRVLAAELNLVPGACWREEETGNTALSMARAIREPVQVTGTEHYCRCYYPWSDAAAPFFSPEGQVAGLLGLFIPAEEAHPHTLGMVAAMARAVAGELKAVGTLEMQHKYQEAILESMFDGFLTIDGQGRVVYMNASGGRILGVDHKKVIGKFVGDIVDFKPVILEVLKSGRGYVDKEFMVKTSTGFKHFLKTAIPIRDENGRITAVVDTFREIKRVRKLVNKMVGAQAQFTFADIIGNSPPMREALRLARMAAHSSSPVLIQGESGTGKELFAQSIHNASSRRDGPFVALNCAALPHELIESELFGYEEGAFTGACRGGRPGKFELASGGTIFLDEIGDMPLDMQAKLLRVLEEKRVVRLGGHHYIDCDVRVIAATNRDLAQEVERGNFRRDLYYRLNVIYIPLPPLRQRGADIELFIEHFSRQIGAQLGREPYPFASEALQVMRSYPWPGNVRELKNIIERVLNMAPGPVVTGAEVCKHLRSQAEQGGLTGEVLSMEEVERQAIQRALKVAGGNVSRAARLLKISRNTLYNKLKKYQLEAGC
ncbi:MAG: sigma 54-interacting transcriptional regulator [bacterium]